MKTVVYVGASIDGYIAKEDGSVDWLPDPPEGEDFGWSDFFPTVDALVMGRATFETLLGFGTWPYEDRPLIVMSRTMTSVPEPFTDKAEISGLAPMPLLEELAARGHERVYVDGGRVVQSFLREDLVDELVVTTVPVLLGGGIPLFGALDAPLPWELVSSTRHPRGLVQNSWRRSTPTRVP